jgi:hypothetical protein
MYPLEKLSSPAFFQPPELIGVSRLMGLTAHSLLRGKAKK